MAITNPRATYHLKQRAELVQWVRLLSSRRRHRAKLAELASISHRRVNRGAIRVQHALLVASAARAVVRKGESVNSAHRASLRMVLAPHGMQRARTALQGFQLILPERRRVQIVCAKGA